MRLNVGFVKLPDNDMTFPSSGTEAVIPAVNKRNPVSLLSKETKSDICVQCMYSNHTHVYIQTTQG